VWRRQTARHDVGDWLMRGWIIGLTAGVVIYLVILLGARALLGHFSPEAGAIVALFLILLYPTALFVGAFLSFRRQRRRQ